MYKEKSKVNIDYEDIDVKSAFERDDQRKLKIVFNKFKNDFDADGFGNRLNLAINYCGKSRKEICEDAKIYETALSTYLKKEKPQKPSLLTVHKLSNACGVQFDWLAGFSHADIEFTDSFNINSVNPIFEKRIEKIALLLIRHLHVYPEYIKEYIKLIKRITFLSPSGIAKVINYIDDISTNEKNTVKHDSRSRYLFLNNSKSITDEDYTKLNNLNNVLKSID